MAFQFVHAADLHLDTPFSGLNASAPSMAAALRDASLAAFEQLVELAIARDVAFVIISGDVYDGVQRGVRAQLELHRGLSRLSNQGISSFVIAGNHDPVDQGWSAIRSWPPLVTIFGSREVRSVIVERGGQAIATVHGISYGTRAVTENLATRFAPGDEPRPHIGVLHANVGGNLDHDPYSPCSLDDLLSSGIDYWALGHIHSRQVLHRDPWVVYPGNLQARSPRAGERGAKGAYVVTVDDGGQIAEPEFVPLDQIRYDRAELAIEDHMDLAGLRDRLIDLGHRHLAEADGRSVLLRVELVGRGRLHGDLHRPGVVVELIDSLRRDTEDNQPFLWWDRLEVATSPLQDLADLRRRNDFVADLVEETAKLLADDPARAARVRGWDGELPADLVHLLGDAMPSPASPRRWEAAQELAVDLLAGDE